jgi:hypothetical protein
VLLGTRPSVSWSLHQPAGCSRSRVSRRLAPNAPSAQPLTLSSGARWRRLRLPSYAPGLPRLPRTSPLHTISCAAMVGGGPDGRRQACHDRPGVVLRAHRGGCLMSAEPLSTRAPLTGCGPAGPLSMRSMSRASSGRVLGSGGFGGGNVASTALEGVPDAAIGSSWSGPRRTAFACSKAPIDGRRAPRSRAAIAISRPLGLRVASARLAWPMEYANRSGQSTS